LFFFSLLIAAQVSVAQKAFSDYFSNGTLLVSFDTKELNGKIVFCGSFRYSMMPEWNGSERMPSKSIVDSDRRIQMVDNGGEVLFSYSYSSLLDEWMTICDKRREYRKKPFHEILQLPFPKSAVSIVLQRRGADGKYVTYHEELFDPAKHVKDFRAGKVETMGLMDNGDSRHKVDLVILSSGYDAGNIASYDSVATFFVSSLFEYEPFKSNKDKFNVTLIRHYGDLGFTPGIFGIDRYQGTWDYTKAYMKVLGVPCDTWVLFTNSDKYIGGGIYNNYAVYSDKNPKSVLGMIHEFGHSFAGLDDEYEYTGEYGDKKSNYKPESECMMRALQYQFCPECQKRILETIKYWCGE